MTENNGNKPRQQKNKKLMLVRYGRMENLGFFEHNEAEIPRSPKRVVVKTERGLELGSLIGQLLPYKDGNFKLNDQQIKKYFDDSGVQFSTKPVGRFIRYADAEDLSEERHLRTIASEEMDTCRKFVKELGLSMKVVDADHIFGGERIIYYFMADARVDFRQLVKKLAHEYQTRIEMRQIGARDEAKLLGDYETCGQQCCCIRFLKTLKPVNMRMAKMQKATLDPSKISGYCGRLKCCLRYEDKNYTELKKRLPKKNTRVKTPTGNGRVLDGQILTQMILIELEDGNRVAYALEEIEILGTENKPQQKKQDKEPPKAKSADNQNRGRRRNRGNRPDRNNKKAGNGNSENSQQDNKQKDKNQKGSDADSKKEE